MRKVKLNDKPVSVVDRWDEVRLDQLLKLETINAEDEVEVFSVLSGINVTVVENSKAITDEIYRCIAFIYTQAPDWKNLTPPTHLVIDGKPYKLPKPDKCTLGQNIMLDNLMAKPMIEILPRVLAIYFQPLIDGGKFDRHRLDDVERLILQANAIDCCAAASFFLRSGKNLLRIFQVGYLLQKPIPLPPSQTTGVTKSTDGLSG